MEMAMPPHTRNSTPFSTPESKGWRAIVTGKGGSGKTTLAALLALCAAQEGEQVLAVDTDPQEALAYCLGVPFDRAHSLVPLCRNAQFLEKMTIQKRENGGKQRHPLHLNSDDIQPFVLTVRDRVRLLVLGSVDYPLSGCLCPEHALVEAVLRTITRGDSGVVIVDGPAGIKLPKDESAPMFSHALIVAEPGFHALRIAEKITTLFLDLGIPHLHLAVNKIRTEEDVAAVKRFAAGLTCYEHVFSLPYDEGVRHADPDTSLVLGEQTGFMSGVWTIYHALRGDA
jgi:CO dehydrogenase maturation factor